MAARFIDKADPEIASVLDAELARQRGSIELIASENFTSLSVLEAVGSVLTNKYAEGYPGKRYYGGCEEVDVAETIACERVCELFKCTYANVQPHSGSQANAAAYQALIEPGDTVLGMSLAHGGHLTHGSPVSFSGKLYDIFSYGVDPLTETIDMDVVEKMAHECKPKIIIAGASAYPRILDFERFGQIAQEVGAYLMVDMAHIAGLVAGGVHPSPFPYADIVTSTSHKTLRGPRGGFVLTNSLAIHEAINKTVFPGMQGGPLMHVVAGKAVAFGEALKPEFSEYAKQTVINSARLGKGMIDGGLRLVSGGTDNHLCLVDLTPANITGKDAEHILDAVGITCNKNTIPNEKLSPSVASGIRLGMAAMTTRGIDGDEAELIGELIAYTLFNHTDASIMSDVCAKVEAILLAHPLYPELG